MVGRHLAERGVRDLDGNRPLAAWKPDWNIDVDEALGQRRRRWPSTRCASTRADPRRRSSTPAEIDEAFDAIAYEKGAAVLRMIESYVGAETFRKGINAYLQAHAYGNATSEDFWKAIATASGKPVDRILPTFVNQPGVPLVDVSIASRAKATGRPSRLTQQRFVIGRGHGRERAGLAVAGADLRQDAAATATATC